MNDNKRTIIITGGGSGIGMETAIKFAENGDNVIITGRTESKLIKVSESINNNNGSCSYYTGDVADPDFVSKTVNSVIFFKLQKFNIHFLSDKSYTDFLIFKDISLES